MTDILKFDFCEIHIYDFYLVVIMNEGLTVLPRHNTELNNVVDTYFNNKEFVYISHRINSYSVNPATLTETSKIKNIIGFAVVSNDYKAKSNADVEKLFFNKPYETFDKLEEAISWAEFILKK